jgi:hypothetical protein
MRGGNSLGWKDARKGFTAGEGSMSRSHRAETQALASTTE